MFKNVWESPNTVSNSSIAKVKNIDQDVKNIQIMIINLLIESYQSKNSNIILMIIMIMTANHSNGEGNDNYEDNKDSKMR